jgi:hypothetical protein
VLHRGQGCLLYRQRRGEGPGCLQWPTMKEFNASQLEGIGYWRNEEGGHHLMGAMKEEVMQHLFPCCGGGHGGSVGLVTAAATPALLY